MASSEEGFRWPLSLRPRRSVMTRSSGVIMPLLMAVGEVSTRCGSSRTEMLPSVEATKPRPWIQRPTVQTSRRCSSSLFTWPGEMDSGSMLGGPTSVGVCRNPLLGVNPAELQRKRDAVNRQHVRGDAVVHVMRVGIAHHFVEAVLNDVLQAPVDLVFAPEKPLPVLHPFEVADGDAARIRQNVGDHEHALLLQDFVGERRRGAVGAFAEDARLDAVRVFGGDLVLDGGGQKNEIGRAS